MLSLNYEQTLNRAHCKFSRFYTLFYEIDNCLRPSGEETIATLFSRSNLASKSEEALAMKSIKMLKRRKLYTADTL